MNELEEAITKSIEDSIDVIANRYPTHEFFAVAVSTDTDLASLMISANSTENLKEVLLTQKRVSTWDNQYFKWCREEWGVFDSFSEIDSIAKAWKPSYELKCKLIEDSYNKHHSLSDSDYLLLTGDDLDILEPISNNTEFLLSTICRALSEVKNSTWEKLNHRSELLVFCTCEPDQEEPVRWNSAKWLNEDKVKPELLNEFKEIAAP